MDDSFRRRLIRSTTQAFLQLFGTEISERELSFLPTKKEFIGDVTLVLFPLISRSKRSIEELGAALGTFLNTNLIEIESFNLIKGFLNIVLSDSYWIESLQKSAASSAGTAARNGKTVLVEFSSPNTNKPLHLGHIRNNVLGFSICEILNAAGYEVIRTCLVNDRGIHICKSMVAWKRFSGGETPVSSGLKGDHLVGKYYVLFDSKFKQEVAAGIASGLSEGDAARFAPLIVQAQEMLQKWEAGDAETLALWSLMNSWVYEGFKETYSKLGIWFDKTYYESNTYNLGKELIQQGLEQGVFFKKPDGSVWIDLTAEGLDEKLVLRGDGTSVYITQDLGTARLKYEDYHADQSVFVVGNEQDYHFKVLFLILKKLGVSWAGKQMHMSYGMVDLPSGKMKSREGTVVDADELIEEMYVAARMKTEELGKVGALSEKERDNLYSTLGMGALKYFLLRVDPKKRLLFNPQESIEFQGSTGPSVQYSYARISSLIRKAGLINIDIPLTEINLEERSLIKHLASFHDVVGEAAELMRPDIVATYLYETARLFNHFYHTHQVLTSTGEQLRLRVGLCQETGKVLKKGMSMLGIQVPEQM